MKNSTEKGYFWISRQNRKIVSMNVYIYLKKKISQFQNINYFRDIYKQVNKKQMSPNHIYYPIIDSQTPDDYTTSN